MRALVLYESMYGNTRAVAEAIATGLGTDIDVTVQPVHSASPQDVRDADVVVVGGPTHAHGMSRPSTRRAAATAASKPASTVELEPGATGSGLREWLESIGALDCDAAAFDTRMRGPALLTGRAAKGIARGLERRGCTLIAPPESFFVTRHETLRPGELERATAWGTTLARLTQASARLGR
jgi:hypothetical protein